MLLKHFTSLMSSCHGYNRSLRGGVMATDYSLPTWANTQERCCGGVCVCKICQRKVKSTSLLFSAFALSAVVKSYRAVISDSPRGPTHSPLPSPAFIFTSALLSELQRFASELIYCLLVGASEKKFSHCLRSLMRLLLLLCLSTVTDHFCGFIGEVFFIF